MFFNQLEKLPPFYQTIVTASMGYVTAIDL